MPRTKQLLNPNIHHLRSRHGTHPSPEAHVGSDPGTHHYGARADAQADGEYQELWRVPREPASCESAVYSVFRYVVSLPPPLFGTVLTHITRRLPDRSNLHRRRHPLHHQEIRPHQLRQARQNRRSHPRHPAIPERALPPPARAGAAGVYFE